MLLRVIMASIRRTLLVQNLERCRARTTRYKTYERYRLMQRGSLDQLVSFVAVARERSFTGAAAKLNVS